MKPLRGTQLHTANEIVAARKRGQFVFIAADGSIRTIAPPTTAEIIAARKKKGKRS